MLISVFVFGLSIIAFGLSSIYWVSVFALFVSGAADGISMVIRQTILQIKTPDEMRGRVSSVNSMFVGSSKQKTLPWQMFIGLKEQISPTILAVATILVCMSIALLVTLELLRRRSERLRGLSPS